MSRTPGPWTWQGNWLSSPICPCVLYYTTGDDGLHGEEADKALIAAAPDMLEALKRLRAVLYDGILNSDGADVEAALKAMVAAIAKAKGDLP